MVALKVLCISKIPHSDMNGFLDIIDENNHHGKNVMPSMGHSKIKKGN
jgi:hypothetical protein